MILASRVGAFCGRGRIPLSTLSSGCWLSPIRSARSHQQKSVLPWKSLDTPSHRRHASQFFVVGDQSRVGLVQRFSSNENWVSADREPASPFQPGDKIQVEVLSFGPLGASVAVVGDSHDPDCVIPETQPPLGRGLILQKEIHYFRQARQQVDVVRGEILPAYVERVRENGSLDVALRAFGAKAKADELAVKILERLGRTSGGVLDIGDKSAPEDIQREFSGVSKASFKRAVATLYRQGKVQPGPFSITLLKLSKSKEDQAG